MSSALWQGRSVRTAIAALIGILWLADAASAEIVELTDMLPGHPGVTYFDLMKLVVTDIEVDPPEPPTAHTIVPYRHIEGAKARTEPAGPIAIKYLEPLNIHAGGPARLALMADLGDSDEAVAEFVLLALFDMTDEPKLLDVVEVGRDRLTGFGTPALTPLGNGTDLINIDSDHFNSNEDFVVNELLFVRNDRFELVDSLFTFDVKMCAFSLTEEPSVSTRLARGERYRRILLNVREKREVMPDAASCDDKPPRPFAQNYSTVYRWDAHRGRFVAISGNMKKLDAENDRLMNPK
jgi:hypothetical protein